MKRILLLAVLVISIMTTAQTQTVTKQEFVNFLQPESELPYEYNTMVDYSGDTLIIDMDIYSVANESGISLSKAITYMSDKSIREAVGVGGIGGAKSSLKENSLLRRLYVDAGFKYISIYIHYKYKKWHLKTEKVIFSNYY